MKKLQKFMILCSSALFIALLFSTPASAATAPNLVLDTEQGRISLEQYKGQVVYLDFWASWCKPCRKSFPWMNEMQHRYGKKGLQVIAVNVDTDRALVKKFLAKYKADFQIAYDAKGESAQRYQVKGMPSSYLIDRKGNLYKKHIGFREKDRDEMELHIRKLLSR